MPKYRYTATNLDGKKIAGVFEGTDAGAVVNMLRSKDYYPLELSEISEKPEGSMQIEFFRKIPLKHLALFCGQLSTVLKAGVPLVQALDVLRQQTENRKLRSIIAEVYERIQAGRSLSEAFREHADRFPVMFLNMLEAGEMSGTLETVLARMSLAFEKEHRLRKRVQGAMIYPAIVSCLCVVVVIGLITFVVPIFAGLFASASQQLPFPTRALLWISSFVKQNWFALLLAAAAAMLCVRAYIRSERGSLAYASFKLNMPVFGKLNRKVVSARFTRTLGTLLSSGVPLTQSLEITAKAVSNKAIEKGLMFVTERVREGQGLASPLSGSGLFPPMVVNMIKLGEESGTIEDMLSKTADFFDSEADTALQQMTSLIEPLVIVVMGGIVMFIVLSMVLPMFKLYSFASSALG